jgi:glycerol-3-phosphate acyltransferase PlsY
VGWVDALWVVGAYLIGTLPSTLIVSRVRHAPGLEAASRRRAGETDPHILMASQLGVGWAAVAAACDLIKGLGFVLAARAWGDLRPSGLAMVGVAVVVGHAFPFYARHMAGRGLAATAGVYLVLLPAEMVGAGVLILAGAAVRTTGLATTIGMGLVPVVAAIQGQPPSFVVMSAAILVVLMLRRLEGVGDVVRSGIRPARAVLYRCVFDSSGPPRGIGRRPPRPP